MITGDSGFQFEYGPLSDDGHRAVDALSASGVVPEENGVYDVSPTASNWFVGACSHIAQGYALVIDYGYPATRVVLRPSSVRDFRGLFRAYGH